MNSPPLCRCCDVAMAPGVAMAQTVTGRADFPGQEVVTLAAGGPGRLIVCLKCPACGHSVTVGPS